MSALSKKPIPIPAGVTVAETAGGFVKEIRKKLIGKKKFLDIDLPMKAAVQVMQFKIVSKPSRHLYKKSQKLFPVKQGYGLAVVSASQGLMTGGEARKRRLGGEYLFEVW